VYKRLTCSSCQELLFKLDADNVDSCIIANLTDQLGVSEADLTDLVGVSEADLQQLSELLLQLDTDNVGSSITVDLGGITSSGQTQVRLYVLLLFQTFY